MRTVWWWVAAAVLLAGYLVLRQYYGNVGAVAVAALDPGCKDAKALTSPKLAEMYDFSAELAHRWKPDAVVVRLDNLAMSGPLTSDGSSTHWTAAFYSPAGRAGMMIHTGDGQIYCSHHSGEAAGNIPSLKPDFVRDGAALYTMAEKNGREQLAKGLGVGVVLWASGEGHATWLLEFVDRAGYPAPLRVVVDANTGKLEEVHK